MSSKTILYTFLLLFFVNFIASPYLSGDMSPDNLTEQSEEAGGTEKSDSAEEEDDADPYHHRPHNGLVLFHFFELVTFRHSGTLPDVFIASLTPPPNGLIA